MQYISKKHIKVAETKRFARNHICQGVSNHGILKVVLRVDLAFPRAITKKFRGNAQPDNSIRNKPYLSRQAQSPAWKALRLLKKIRTD
jgi:hypothetical protein